EILSRNYRSIEAAEGMARVVAALRLAVRDGRCPSACADLRSAFERWLAVEHSNYTEPGEPELADRIDTKARALFASATAGAPIAHQPRAEVEQVGDEYRRMAERLEGFEQLNVEAVLDEKAKTEAVIESIDDGLVVLDPAGSVLHMNEVARAILGLEQIEVPGVSFDRLGSEHPHYLRLREAVRELLTHPDREPERVELALFLRGRDHYYVLRPTPLR